MTRWGRVVLLTVSVRLLLVNLYVETDGEKSKSTDFDVHCGWKAITHHLDRSQWYYYDETEWTLDYPPFFAWFEWLWGLIASFVFSPNAEAFLRLPPGNCSISPVSSSVPLSHPSLDPGILFMRLSVILSDVFFLVPAVLLCQNAFFTSSPKKLNPLLQIPAPSLFLLLNCGLLLIDHIHFQYNGFLISMFLLVLVAFKKNHHGIGCLLFMILLNFKHMALYMAPAVLILLLREILIGEGRSLLNKISLFFQCLLSTILVFSLSLGPFIDHLPQLISRLFPFGRGLTHAYWAPNFWALYNTADKILSFVFVKILKKELVSIPSANMVGGIVGSDSIVHAILPEITPRICTILCFLTIIPSCVTILRFGSRKNFDSKILPSIVHCTISMFMFGYHVHEKAILWAIIPLSLLLASPVTTHRQYLALISLVGHFSILPLLFSGVEIYIKTALWIGSSVAIYNATKNLDDDNQALLFGRLWKVSFVVLLGLELFVDFLHPSCSFFFDCGRRLPFLPLLLISSVSSLFLFCTWIHFGFHLLFRAPPDHQHQKTS